MNLSGSLAVSFVLLGGSTAAADVLKDKDGKVVLTYAVSPSARRAPGSRLGLVICCHGRGGNEKQLVEGAVAALQKAGIRDEYVVCGIKSKEDGWTDKDDEPVKQFVAWAVKTWTIDARRVYGIGLSSGAFYLNRFVPNHTELFAGAVTYVGGQGGLAKTDRPEAKAELYWIVGTADTQVRIETVRPQMQAAKAAGYRFVYREIAGMGHEMWGNPPLDDGIQWLKSIRNKEAPLAPEEQAFVDKFADPAKSTSLLGEGATWLKAAAIGGPAAAPIVLLGLSNDREGPRVQAAQTCARMMFDGKVVDALAGLLDDQEARVRGAAIQALVFQGRWSDAAAQAALCGHARNSKASAGERKASTLGLGEILKLDYLGAFQFKTAAWTLVDLLDDDDGGVRQAAFLSLLPAKGAIDGPPGASKPAREAAVSKAAAWCEKSYGPRATP